MSKPFGVFSKPGSGDVSPDDVSFVSNLVHRADNIKGLAGLEAIRMTRALPDGGTALVMIHGDTRRVIVQKPSSYEPEQEVYMGPELPTGIPMLFSGRITKARVPQGEKVAIRFTDTTRRRLVNYDDKADLPPKDAALAKLTIPNPPRFSEFDSAQDPQFRSQYVGVRPTWYSGAMAQVMQIVGGYGKRLKKEDKPSELDKAQVTLPAKVRAAGDHELRKRGNLPGYRGMPPADGQFRYDYKHHQCHAVAFGSDKKPWLLQIDRKGVHAKPLPLIPMTTTDAYREWIEEKGDSEIQWILERFGGLPSGEGFPTKEAEFEAWKKAGVIVKVCDTADFYDHIAYTSACGWSFNLSGNEGYNTCYDYDDGEGLAYGLTYGATVTIGAMPEDKKRDDGDLSWEEQRKLNAYMAAIYEQAKGDQDNGDAVRYKVSKASISDLFSLANSQTPTQAYDYWLNYVREPLASCNGTVVQVAKGWLNNGNRFEYGPQIKMPEPLLGYCLSFDFRPLENGRGKSPKCDTIMWAYYLGDDLITAKYFRDERQKNKEPEDDYTDCMIVGSWTRTEHLGLVGLQGLFYSSDVDERDEFAEHIRVTKIKGEDKGYDTTPLFEFDAWFGRPGTLRRRRWFTHLTNTNTEEGKYRTLGLCVPFYTRAALLTAVLNTTTSESSSENLSLNHVRDPHEYRYWTYDFLMHWSGSLPIMAGQPYPKNASPVWVEFEQFNPMPCSEWADDGPWIEGFPQDYTWLIHPVPGEYPLSNYVAPPPVKEYSKFEPATSKEEGHIMFSMMVEPVKLNHKPHGHYFVASPSETGLTFYRDACQIVAGEREYCNVSEPPTEARSKWGYTALADHESAHIFVGVINE